MQHCDLLINAEWCVPVEGPTTVLEDHAVAVADGRIVGLLPCADAVREYQPSRTIERPGHVLIPGLINTHTHAAMTLFRGFGDDLALEPWLKQRIWPAEKRWLGPEFVRDGTALAIAEMLLGGVTCFADQYFFPEIVAGTAVDLNMRAVVGTPVLDFETEWARDTREYLEKSADLVHDPYADHPMVTSAFAPHSTAALDDDAFVELRVMADQLDIPVQIHLHETVTEIHDALAATGMRPLERLANLGLVNRSLLAVHAVHLTDDEVKLLAGAGVSVAHCPRSNLKLASGIASTAGYREAGINVAIGTDGAASNNVLDMLLEMQTASLLAKAVSQNAQAVGAFDSLSMATLGGARALGLESVTGSISVGKWADLACVDLRALNSQPVYDPVSNLVYTATSNQVADVWVAGRQQVENGKLTDIDVEDIAGRANEWSRQIRSN
jgi:5-methylthioadenosine/S-adenosylhomocysteine deaminase